MHKLDCLKFTFKTLKGEKNINLCSEFEGSSNSDRMLPLLAVACPSVNINQVTIMQVPD